MILLDMEGRKRGRDTKIFPSSACLLKVKKVLLHLFPFFSFRLERAIESKSSETGLQRTEGVVSLEE